MIYKFLILVHICTGFPLKCPEPAQWSIRARGHCPDPAKYFCLKNDLNNGYSENCTVFDFLQPGRKHVLRGGLDADLCSSQRFQPWPLTFYTNVSTNCIFFKSLCNEEGQIVFGTGNRNTDTRCRCDYTRGYDFLIKPQHLCFCVPAEEDCSCYLKTCPESTFKLSPDYECIYSLMNKSTYQCGPIIHGKDHRNGNIKIHNISRKVDISNIALWKICAEITSVLCIGLILVFYGKITLDKYYCKENKSLKMCNFCETMPVYKCYDCEQVLCKDCSRKHDDKKEFPDHVIHLLSDRFMLNCKHHLTSYINEIKCLSNGLMVVSKRNLEVMTISVFGEQRHVLQLQSNSARIDVVDKNTVAVLLEDKRVAKVNIHKRLVKYSIIDAMQSQPIAMVYKKNQFYVNDGFGIALIDMSGSVTRPIELSFIPVNMCYDVDSKRIYCIDMKKLTLICLDRNGKTIFTFTDPKMTDLTDLTIDNEGNVLALCRKEDDNLGYVIKIDPKDRSIEEVITNIKKDLHFFCICFNHFTKSIVIGVGTTVYIYKRKSVSCAKTSCICSDC